MQEEAEENSITTSQLLGYLLHRENYVKDSRALAAVGMQVFSNIPVGKELSLDEGLYILSQYKLGRTS